MTAFLLDTHALLWWRLGDPNLSPTSREVIADPAADLWVSTATLWEIAIKVRTGKLTNPGHSRRLIQEARCSALDISYEHIETIKSLPLHHRDPFDRLLIAQALAENMTLISNETVFDAYGVRRIWD